jgi:hypothetical protein
MSERRNGSVNEQYGLWKKRNAICSVRCANATGGARWKQRAREQKRVFEHWTGADGGEARKREESKQNRELSMSDFYAVSSGPELTDARGKTDESVQF